MASRMVLARSPRPRGLTQGGTGAGERVEGTPSRSLVARSQGYWYRKARKVEVDDVARKCKSLDRGVLSMSDEDRND
jgi:hypothetical protein